MPVVASAKVEQQLTLAGGLARMEKPDEALDAAQGACRAGAKRLRPRPAIADIRLWAGRIPDTPAAFLEL